MAEFGQKYRQHFLLDKDYTCLNHGSYGAIARSVYEAKQRKQLEFEELPDRWFLANYWDYYKENIEAAADFLGANPQNIVFTRNTSAGINSVLRCLTLGPGDKILTNSWTYHPMKHAVQWVTEKTGAEFVMTHLRVPLDKDSVIQSFRDVIEKHGSSIRLAIIDYISSIPPVLMPWAELVSLCKEKNILVLVDGAHAPCQIDLNLKTMPEVDFFIGNLHKWSYTPRGCAVLYVNSSHLNLIDPLITSTCAKEADIRRRFHYQGTDDFTTYCVVKDAMSFMSDMGGTEAIRCYNRSLVTKAAEMLVKRWGTRMLEVPRDMEAPNMKMIRLPDLKKYPAMAEIQGDMNTVVGLQKDLKTLLMDRFKIVVYPLSLQGELYVRISANIYNSMEDYERLAEAITQLKIEDMLTK